MRSNARMFERLVFGSATFAGALIASSISVYAQEKVRFGAPLPITGALAPEAAKAQQGFDLWAERVNEAGGIKVGDRRLKVEMDRKVRYELDGGDRTKVRSFKVDVEPGALELCVPPAS